jgi:hypothetical protein
MFSYKSRQNREPTSGLEPLTSSNYEFASVCSSASYCVRELRLSLRFWTIWQSHFVQCVPARISTVAVHSWPSIRARDELFGVGEEMTEVGVRRVTHGLEERIVGCHNDPVPAPSARALGPLLLCFSSPRWWVLAQPQRDVQPAASYPTLALQRAVHALYRSVGR